MFFFQETCNVFEQNEAISTASLCITSHSIPVRAIHVNLFPHYKCMGFAARFTHIQSNAAIAAC